MPNNTEEILSAASHSDTEVGSSAKQPPKDKAKAAAATTKARAKQKGGGPDPQSLDPDLSSSEYFLNRELTWLHFNSRVLHEAGDPRTPLLERVNFWRSPAQISTSSS